ncbi:hypothetical protein ACWJJH_03325 [Endozoicomonadaceae bacterium StTr2]
MVFGIVAVMLFLTSNPVAAVGEDPENPNFCYQNNCIISLKDPEQGRVVVVLHAINQAGLSLAHSKDIVWKGLDGSSLDIIRLTWTVQEVNAGEETIHMTLCGFGQAKDASDASPQAVLNDLPPVSLPPYFYGQIASYRVDIEYCASDPARNTKSIVRTSLVDSEESARRYASLEQVFLLRFPQFDTCEYQTTVIHADGSTDTKSVALTSGSARAFTAKRVVTTKEGQSTVYSADVRADISPGLLQVLQQYNAVPKLPTSQIE